MDTVRRRLSSVFSSSRRPSDEYGRERVDGPGPSTNRGQMVLPSTHDFPFRSRLNSGAGSMDQSRRPSASERPSDVTEFLRLGKVFRYSHEDSRWLPPTKGYIRILTTPSGLRRLQARTDKTYETSTLVINCYITPTMTLFSRGPRAFTFSTAADWSFGESTWETFAVRFSERVGGAVAADDFATEFEKARKINNDLLEGKTFQPEPEADLMGLRVHGSKTSLGSFGGTSRRLDGGKLLKKQSRSMSQDGRRGQGWGL